MQSDARNAGSFENLRQEETANETVAVLPRRRCCHRPFHQHRNVAQPTGTTDTA